MTELPEGTAGPGHRRPSACPCSPPPGWDGCTSESAQTPAAGYQPIGHSGDLWLEKCMSTSETLNVFLFATRTNKEWRIS